MIRNYFKTAWRNIWSNKLFSSIHVLSLAIGLSASFIIGSIVYYDNSFDKFHEGGDRIYRITSDFSNPQVKFYNSGVATPLGTTLKHGLPGVKYTSSFFTTYPTTVKNIQSTRIYKEPKKVVYADENYFKIFSYQWIAGNEQNNLTKANELVLTENKAKKYFPKLKPKQIIGKTLIYNDSVSVNVTGIVANHKKRSDLIFEEFISLQTAYQSDMKEVVFNEEWNNTNSASQLFIKIEENTKSENIQNQLNLIAKEHEDSESIALGQHRMFHLQALDDIHFNQKYGIFDYSTGQGSKSVLTGLAFIALFLLLMGCINFINLNTAEATKRSKEIGIRKTLGGSKKQLVFQFLLETFILTLVSALVSLFLSVWLLQLFEDFLPKGLAFNIILDPVIGTYILVLLLAITLFAGFYPALVLSNFKPISALKNQVISGSNKTSLRKYLTVFQFVIAQIFVIATILVGKQVHFLMNKDMGFKTDAIAYVRTPWKDASLDKRIRLAKEINSLAQIGEVSLSGNPPASSNTHITTVTFLDKKKEIHTGLQLLYGDQKYLDLYDIKLLAGRNRINDTIREYIINETYSKILGFKNPKDAIGQILITGDNRDPIVGVMQDFNQRSLKSTIDPMAIIGDWSRNRYSQFNTIHFSIQANNSSTWPKVIAKIENFWKDVYPDTNIELKFIDESVKKFYEQERKISVLLNWATGLAILISCLGLFGLVVFTTDTRTKEIGIRKVLGASLARINLILFKDFLLLIAIAFAISVPIAWWGLNKWLMDFAYKTELSWWIFVLSGVFMALVALLIMSTRTIAAAKANPVESLKTE